MLNIESARATLTDNRTVVGKYMATLIDNKETSV
jgi:hypothetical protein